MWQTDRDSKERTSAGITSGSASLRPQSIGPEPAAGITARLFGSALTVWHKGLIVVLIPVICQIVLIMAVSGFVHQADAASLAIVQSFQILKHSQKIQSLWSRVLAAQVECIRLGAGMQSEELEQATAVLQQELSELQGLKGSNAEQSARIDCVIHAFLQAGSLAGGTAPSGQVALSSAFKLGTSGLAACLRLGELVAHEEALHRVKVAELSQLRRSINNLLMAGIVFNVLLAIDLSSFFAASIIQRLKIILTNTVALEHHLPLSEPISGCDEIAVLDGKFHDMARALTATEQRLKASESRLASVLRDMPVGLLILGEGDKIEAANPKARELFGLGNADVNGISISRFVGSPGLTGSGGATASVSAGEYTGMSSCGKRFAVELSTSQLKTAAGQKVLVSIQDLTERHRLAQLKQEFLSVISDDLRSPLVSARECLTRLEQGNWGPLSEAVLKNIGSAKTNVSRLLALTDDLTDLAQATEGRRSVRLAPVDMAQALNDAAAAVAPLADKVAVRIQVSGAAPALKADREKIVQVVINLLSNALKYSPEHSEITVSLVDKPGWQEVRISDRGPGIAEADRQRIFARFEQAGNARRKITASTGLGLAICKAIVDEHGGEIGVESQQGQGSTFWFRIPSLG